MLAKSHCSSFWFFFSQIQQINGGQLKSFFDPIAKEKCECAGAKS